MTSANEHRPSTGKGKPKYPIVRPLQGEILPPAKRMTPTDLNTVSHNLNVPPTSTHHIEMKTSAVDRACGFLIATIPIFGGFALCVVLVAVYWWDVPMWSMAALVIFWLSFITTWLGSFLVTVLVSPEGIALFEAIMKWYVIIREQTARWRYYDPKE